jgi:hypothetical protein
MVAGSGTLKPAIQQNHRSAASMIIRPFFLAAGYARESITGLVLTDLGIRRLEGEEGGSHADGLSIVF